VVALAIRYSLIYAFFAAALQGVAMAYVQRLFSQQAGLGGSIYIVTMQLGSLVGILGPLLASGYDQEIFIVPATLCAIGALLLMIGDGTAQFMSFHDKAISKGAVSQDRSQADSFNLTNFYEPGFQGNFIRQVVCDDDAPLLDFHSLPSYTIDDCDFGLCQ
jgi:MFS family permease